MSLVENALQKMQEQSRARAAATEAQAHVGSRVIETSPIPSAARRQPNVEVAVNTRVVHIDQGALRAAGLLPPERHDHELTEQFRQIKRPLIASATGRSGARIPKGNLIMVTSSLPAEGKTFSSLNLAMSMAVERDIRVLLVDADVAKAHITRLLGLGPDPGLVDALREPSIDIESLVLQTDVPGLSVLPAGQPAEHTTELLASERMQAVAQQLGDRDPHRVILFDSPPLLLTTQAHALAQVLGQVLLIVRAGHTSQENVLDGIERLGEGKPISVVLNQSLVSSGEGYQYYGQAPIRETSSGS